MALMTKLKELIPWKRKPVETHEVISLRDDINRLFDRFLTSPFDGSWPRLAGGGPEIEMEETDEEVILRVDVPGLDPKHLDVKIRNGSLHVAYEDEREWREKDGASFGRRYAAFHRTVGLPDGLDASKAEATCKHGVLTVRIPWTPEARDRARTIVVSVD
ncbi:MAG: Hsp20/alpha crystallin family protein [Nitrospira sp.]|nr:Hsp20/alpha crystallin family protein [Nitrospira sp.]MCP9462211.1 Hsp20/alpha crystallin family protein [Nitrospira sp.]MCP9474933.1 Hsp20/alpha crystallin family protein [Nitrospira sp.]